ncbi:TPA: N-acyl-D-amino-acid deacylase family protein [Clostridioides difficile]|uniref:N-acyl-D-amino-acid deacylase family protein n=1 Tax=Clostridioides difficile TaxID=1496 RepID=UPI00093F544A|nr:D-aminoacylase [Clostridioides difficile]EGT3750036.1 D-aminoacylase [Clostridioides difficile]EGT4544769.1 D-aminoacylase [Clostridioides difficile]MBF9859190.1 D-aminoacylase [Clostridioides difficile]MBF9975518.1 D-aminoacylase [Clostridioides difficile]MBH6967584.1 D-aminoacylase [Clostridioides difficile]
MRTLIKHGLIVDGNKTPAYEGDILIENEKILKISQDLNEEADKVIDAKGRVICPGFIDTHSHSDLVILVNPYNEVKIRQGITTEVLGQDGISMAPLPQEHISSWRKNLAGLDGESDEIDWKYETTENYLKMMDYNGVGLNETYLVPHGNVRMEAMGLEDRPATKEEIQKMCEITERELKAGAIGLSTGLIYIPCAYSLTEEIIEMCNVVAKYDGVFVVHQRSEADTILTSMEEIIEIGKQSGVKVHFSHFKVCGKANWKYIPQVIELLEKAEKEGIRVSFDQYPYAAGSTMLGVVLPPWAHSGGTDKLIERLSDENERAKMKKDIANGIEGWDNFIEFAGIDQIFVTSVKTEKNKDTIGKNLLEIGKMRGKDPLDATFDLLKEEENAVGMVDFYGLEEHIIGFMKRDEQNVCTDGLLAGKPHPRAYGSFPKILGRYVRELNVLTIEEAVYKMTKKAATSFSIKDRGELKEGYFADIVIFDKDTVSGCDDFINSMQYPTGIDYVIINGNCVVEEGKYNKIKAGKVLKN